MGADDQVQAEGGEGGGRRERTKECDEGKKDEGGGRRRGNSRPKAKSE
jgi:hypothetical protein